MHLICSLDLLRGRKKRLITCQSAIYFLLKKGLSDVAFN